MFVNVFLTAAVAFIVLQVTPSLVSSSNNFEFYSGIGILLVGLTFVCAKGIEIFETFKKGEK
jgi:hypothetical protein